MFTVKRSVHGSLRAPTEKKTAFRVKGEGSVPQGKGLHGRKRSGRGESIDNNQRKHERNGGGACDVLISSTVAWGALEGPVGLKRTLIALAAKT